MKTKIIGNHPFFTPRIIEGIFKVRSVYLSSFIKINKSERIEIDAYLIYNQHNTIDSLIAFVILDKISYVDTSCQHNLKEYLYYNRKRPICSEIIKILLEFNLLTPEELKLLSIL